MDKESLPGTSRLMRAAIFALPLTVSLSACFHDLPVRPDCSRSMLNIAMLQPKPFTLTEGVAYTAGDSAQSVAAGDFNGDEALDLAVANADDDNLTILLNQGGGRYLAHSNNPATGDRPTALASADFDGDGDDDLVVVNALSKDLSILSSNGDGTFSLTATLDESNAVEFRSSLALATGDLDGDGTPDIAVTRNMGSDDQEVILLWNNGRGGFDSHAPTLTLGTGLTTPQYIAIADFDGDADLDLMISQSPISGFTVNLVENSSYRNFHDGVNTGIPGGPLATGDFNGDGRADLAVNDHSWFRDDSSGEWRQGGRLEPGIAIGSIITADLDNDSLDDVIVAGGHEISVLLSTGDGFEAGRRYPAGGNAVHLIAAELNGRAPPDLAVANNTTDQVTVLVNDSRQAHDLNRNGVTDSCDISSRRSSDCNGNGVPDEADLLPIIDFSPRQQGIARSPFGYDAELVSLDMDEDGDRDLVAANTLTHEDLVYHLNNGSGIFFSHVDPDTLWGTYANLAGVQGISVAAAHLDNNAREDMAVARNAVSAEESNQLLIYRQNSTLGGTSEWGRPAVLTLDEPIGRVTAVELNGDDTPELVVTPHYSSGHIRVIARDNGDFNTVAEIPVAVRSNPITEPPTSVTSADMNGDGHLDLVMSVLVTNRVVICEHTGDLHFGTCRGFDAGEDPRRVRAADLDGDGRPDLVVANDHTTHITKLRNTSGLSMVPGGFHLSAPATLDLGPYARISPQDLVLTDVDNDGDIDIASANWDSNNVSVLANNGSGEFAEPLIIPVGDDPEAIEAIDMDADGRTDLAVGNGDGTLTTLINRSRPAVARDADGDGRPDSCGPR